MKTHRFIKTALLLFVSCFHFVSTTAQWSTNPDVDNPLNATIYDPLTFCSDGHGGAFFAWSQTFDGATHDVIINRIDSLGYLHFGDSGLLINRDHAGVVASGAPNICEDGHGGCYVVYTRNSLTGHPLVCHHFDATGATLWADTGSLVTQQFSDQYYQAAPDLINDGGNGVMMSFVTNGGTHSGLYSQRINFNGDRQWGNTGSIIMLGADHRFPRVISDGSQGMAVVWANYSYDGQGFNYSLRIDCLDHNGSSRFASGSRKLNQTTNIGFGAFYRLVLTANKDFIVAWLRDGIGTPAIFAQKLNASGNFLWGSTEIKVRDTTGEVRNFDMMSDGGEGAYYTWVDGRKVNVSYGQYAQHINGDSTKQWASQGVRIDSSSTGNYGYLAPGTNNQLKVYWVPSPANRMYWQELNSNGLLLLSGAGTALATNGHVPLFYRSVLHVSNNHDILFLKLAGNGKCFAKYVPFDNVLPLTFTGFTAVNKGANNLLTWKTANEINTAYFDVERSEDGSRFYKTATVKSNNNTLTSEYNYNDIAFPDADIFYRIKEVDADGRYIYSDIAIIHAHNRFAYAVMPNPAAKNCTLYFEKIPEKGAVLNIVDINGRQQKQVRLYANQTTTILDVSSFSSGIYFCLLEIDGKIYTRKLVVAKGN